MVCFVVGSQVSHTKTLTNYSLNISSNYGLSGENVFLYLNNMYKCVHSCLCLFWRANVNYIFANFICRTSCDIKHLEIVLVHLKSTGTFVYKKYINIIMYVPFAMCCLTGVLHYIQIEMY